MITLARTGALAAVAILAATSGRAGAAEKLGTVSFANSCAAAVQPQLQRAVSLLHSFWSDIDLAGAGDARPEIGTARIYLAAN